MASVMKLLRRIGGAKAAPTGGEAGELAIYKAGTAATDAMSLYAHDGAGWREVLDTRGKTMSVPVFTDATAAPASPRFGDFWLSTGTNLLSIWDGATWLSTDPHPVATGTAAPTAPTSGALWLDPVKKELQVWDGTRWAHVAFTNVQNTFVQPQLIDVTSTSAALHIKQLGTGAALYIEDEANPDATPFVVDASGKVGIGTAAPTVDLEVHGPTATIQTTGVTTLLSASGSTSGTVQVVHGANFCNFQIDATGTSVITQGTPLALGTASAHPLELRTNGKLWQRINADGTIILNDSGTAVSEVGTDVGATLYPGGIFGVHATNDRVMFVRRSGSDGVLVNLVKNTASVGSISVAGSTVSYATSSDYRLKEDFRPIADPAKQLAALKPINFAWKADGSRVDGFLAHEVAEVVPVAVTGAKDAVDADGNPIYQGIDQAKLVPVLVAALQDALKRIEALEERVASLTPVTKAAEPVKPKSPRSK